MRAAHGRPVQEMERVAQETMDKAVTYQNELENQKLSGQKQVPRGVPTTSYFLLRPGLQQWAQKLLRGRSDKHSRSILLLTHATSSFVVLSQNCTFSATVKVPCLTCALPPLSTSLLYPLRGGNPCHSCVPRLKQAPVYFYFFRIEGAFWEQKHTWK